MGEVRSGARWFVVALVFFVSPFAYAQQRNLNLAPGASASEQRVALVIGNSSYKDAPLKNPVNDATDVAAALRGLGFNVVLRTNSNRRQMVEAVREFGGLLKKGGVGLFYFAGHGVQSKGRNYLVPVGAAMEAEADLEFESMDANMVLAQMDEAGNRVNIVVLDACRNNPFARSFRSAGRGLAQMEAASGSFLAYATAPGQVAADGDGRNGLFTKHLLTSLRDPSSKLEDVFKRVRVAVAQETGNKQIPWDSSSLTGDFYFRAPTVGTQANIAGPSVVSIPDPSSNDRAFWDSVKDSKNPEELKSYLEQFPSGLFVSLAQTRLKALQPIQVATTASSSLAIHTPVSTVNVGLITEAISRLEKEFIVSPDFSALVRGGARELERGILKGKLNVSEGSGLTLSFPASRGGPVAFNRAANASDAQNQLVLVGNLAQEANPSVTSSQIEEALLRGALKELDQYSDFLSREAFKELQVGISGTFGGVGIEVGIRDGWPTVVAPLEGAPAARAGLLAGDRIDAIDGFVTRNVALGDIVGRMRGALGTRATFSIRREGWDTPRDFVIPREIIRINSVSSRELESDIGYIKISQFQQRTPQLLQEVLDGWAGGLMRTPRVKAIVLDLRNDPGGLLNAVAEVAGKFLPEGQLVLTTESRISDGRIRVLAKASGKQIDVPMAVLVNKGSASGSESLAAALQDWKRAFVVGEKTFGKGLVQTILPIAGGYALKLSTAEYRTPKGRNFNGSGIEPDMIVPGQVPAQGADVGDDVQLQAAVLRLKQMINGK